MKNKIKKIKYNNLNGEFSVDGDKSISHRAIMIGSIAEGITEISGFLKGEDCISTIRCFRDLGIKIQEDNITNTIRVHGKGLNGLTKPKNTLDVGNSGTTMRLISGILVAQNFNTTLTGDSSIQKRPMQRVIDPLIQMGAGISSLSNDGKAPLLINNIQDTKNKKLNSINYIMPIATAQVKSAIILASLYASTPTQITEKFQTRNHTELMLKSFGADIQVSKDNKNIIVNPITQKNKLKAQKIDICGDISSASFFIAGALITPNSHIIIKNVGINKTRTGFLDVLIKMGANINLISNNKNNNNNNNNFEKSCDIEVKYSKLTACEIGGSTIPLMIDEIPLFALVASFADGISVVKDAEELKFKESNRLTTTAIELNKIGASIKETQDGLIINGNLNKNFEGGVCESYNDHRIAMMLVIASLRSKNSIELNNHSCINISFPNFFDILDKLNN